MISRRFYNLEKYLNRRERFSTVWVCLLYWISFSNLPSSEGIFQALFIQLQARTSHRVAFYFRLEAEVFKGIISRPSTSIKLLFKFSLASCVLAGPSKLNERPVMIRQGSKSTLLDESTPHSEVPQVSPQSK